MISQKILIIGEVYIDVHLDIRLEGQPVSRLGGIFHAARACSAIGVDYALAFCSPTYLDADIMEWSRNLGSVSCCKFADINHVPNVMLVSESTEAGDQGYCNLLCEQASFVSKNNLLDIIQDVMPSDIIVFPGRFDTNELVDALEKYAGRIHIDCAYDSRNLLDNLQGDIESIIMSTSSPIFKDECHASFQGAIKYFDKYDPTSLLLKEGRGGSRTYEYENQTTFCSPSHNSNTLHSVGVGDVYDVFFICRGIEPNLEARMRLAAYCAGCYSRTMSFAEFDEIVEKVLDHSGKITTLSGQFLPWDDRKRNNIYLAGPDFPDIDTQPLDTLCHSLKYQNFSPRLPIRENGLAGSSDPDIEDSYLYFLDYTLLQQCSLLIATLLHSDPGTFTEIGIFKQMGKPVILYDPHDLCTNMFVLHTVDYVCRDLDSVINSVFEALGERI